MSTNMQRPADDNEVEGPKTHTKVTPPLHTSRDVFRFLLPPELRNRIYDLALIHSTAQKPLKVLQRQQKSDGFRQLLEVCQQVRNESKPIYYATNYFVCVDRNFSTTAGNRTTKWIAAIGLRAVRCLRDFEIAWSTSSTPQPNAYVKLQRTSQGVRLIEPYRGEASAQLHEVDWKDFDWMMRWLTGRTTSMAELPSDITRVAEHRYVEMRLRALEV